MTFVRLFALTTLLVGLFACVDNEAASTLKHGGVDDGHNAPTPNLPPIDAASLTYYKDIKPILAQSCEGCHSEGGLAPFALNDISQVLRYKKSVRSAVINRRMPPWSADPGHQRYRDDLSLNETQIAMITGWVDAGAKAGNAADYVPVPRASFQADLTLPLLPAGTSYTPEQFGDDDYRCFIIPVPAEIADKPWLVGFRGTPGNSKLVHHMVAHTANADILPTLQRLDAEEDGLGYQCIGGGLPDRLGDTLVQEALEAENPGIIDKLMNGTHWLAQWAPGMEGGVVLPKGLGLKLEAGGAIVVQVHYYSGDAKGEADAGTAIGMQLAKQVEKPAFYYPFTNNDWLFAIFNRSMVIPAESEATFQLEHSLGKIASYGQRSLGLEAAEIRNIEMHGAQLHMHSYGMSGEISTRKQGANPEVLLAISSWDRHWQRDYHFLEPKIVAQAEWDQWSRKLSCSYYNPNPSAVYGGLGSNDEMCYDFALFAFDPIPSQ